MRAIRLIPIVLLSTSFLPAQDFTAKCVGVSPGRTCHPQNTRSFSANEENESLQKGAEGERSFVENSMRAGNSLKW